MVPEDTTSPVIGLVNIFADYGARTLEQVAAFEQTYLAQQNQNLQDSKMIYDLIMDSLSSAGYNRVALWKGQYKLEIAGREYEAGLCLLKIVVQESDLDSKAVVSAARLQLSSLDNYVRTNGSNILGLNAHVMELIKTLNARGETTHDLVVNLFKGYKACSDKKFNDYICSLENEYNDNKIELTYTKLMTSAANYYRKRVASMNDTPWESDPIAEKITALETKVARAGSTKSSKQKQQKKQRQSGSQRPKWLVNNEKPKDVHETRKYANNTYHYCCRETGGKCGGVWRIHKPTECQGKAHRGGGKSSLDTGKTKRKKGGNDVSKPSKQRKEEARRIIQANQAILAQSTDDEDGGTSDASSE